MGGQDMHTIGQSVPEPLAAAAAADPGDVEVGDPHTESPEQARERLAARARLRSERFMLRMPDDYRTAALTDFDPQVQAKVEAWLADPKGRTLVVAGPGGVGKTHLGYAIGHATVAAGLWTEAYTVHDLLLDMRPGSDKPVSPYETEHRVKVCGSLLLDDLGAQSASPWATDVLTSIIDARVHSRRKTIITTNNRWAQLEEAWDSRMMDRLRKGLAVITMLGKSRREPLW
jgi:DNA replication protein DnaC